MGQVIDFTAYRLEKMVETLDNPEDAEIVLGILSDYYEGDIAIAWKAGHPVIMQLEPESASLRGIPPGFSVVGYEPALVDEGEDEDMDEDDGG